MRNIGARLRALGVLEVLREHTASRENYTSESGVNFSVDHREFASYLGSIGFRGVRMGVYLRGEEPLPDSMLQGLISGHGAKVLRGPRLPQQKRLPWLHDLWDKLVQEVFKAGEKSGAESVKDMFVQMPRDQEAEDLDQYLQSISGDLTYSLEYALEGKAKKFYDQYMALLRSGEYEYEVSLYDRGEYNNFRWVKERLGESFSEGWYEGASKRWTKLPDREKARLQALRS